jgi:uncharacterized protein YcbK (DUF882 family)
MRYLLVMERAGWIGIGAVLASVFGATLASPVAGDALVSHTSGHAAKKGVVCQGRAAPPSAGPSGAMLLGTLVQTHTDERLPLDDTSPSQPRFDALLADRATGATHPLDPQLLGLLRALAARHPLARVELVSGFRSEKLNEMLRKKGHHVALHSQHSLGHAVDFRFVLPDESAPMNPLVLEGEIRALGWEGGTGVYLGKDDRFVHADVGPRRRWNG